MILDKKNVLVLFGGASPEHEISKLSADTVIKHLSEEKYHIIPVYITQEGKWLLYDGTIDQVKNVAWEKFGTPAILSPDRINRGLLRIVGDKVKTIPVDVVFPVLHGENGEDGTIQGLCQLAGIPYIGCGILASAVSMDKTFTKIIAEHAGIAQSKYLTVAKYELEDPERLESITKEIQNQLGFPCFIKPACAGSSVGITRATNEEDIEEGLKVAAGISNKIVVEKAVNGREIECGVIGIASDDDIEVTIPGEIVSAKEFYDYEAKYHNSESKTLIPASISKEITEQIQQKAAAIFKAVDGKGLARVDFFLDEENNIIFNEINTFPGFTSISMFSMLWEASGIPLTDVLDTLVEIAMR
ncbi:MAG: D-alanine--D-alanine ligase [Defluviitaleaceae bacterium]|nr:D-alanine--D-alanine ligase [Defluviitaleaceae bacterium]